MMPYIFRRFDLDKFFVATLLRFLVVVEDVRFGRLQDRRIDRKEVGDCGMEVLFPWVLVIPLNHNAARLSAEHGNRQWLANVPVVESAILRHNTKGRNVHGYYQSARPEVLRRA